MIQANELIYGEIIRLLTRPPTATLLSGTALPRSRDKHRALGSWTLVQQMNEGGTDDKLLFAYSYTISSSSSFHT